MTDMDTDNCLEQNAFEEGSRELFALLEDLEANIAQDNQTTSEEGKSAEIENKESDFLDFFENLDIETIIPLANCSNSDGGIEGSENKAYYEPAPCQVCAAKGKNFMKKLIFINYEEALYMCENVECENDSADIAPIRINFWDKPLTVEEIENLNLPGEILQHIPVITYADAKKILYIAKYRAALQNFALAKKVLSVSYNIQSKLLEKSDAELVDVGAPPCKSDFCLAEISDYEVKSIFNILDSIDKVMFASKRIDEIILQNKQKKSKSQISSELPSIDVNAEKPAPKESQKVSSNPKRDKKKSNNEELVFYDPETGKVMGEDKVRISKNKNAKMMINSWNNQLKKLAIHKA